MGPAESNQPLHKSIERRPVGVPTEGKPVCIGIQIVRVIIALNAAQILISTSKHRRAGAEHQEGKTVAGRLPLILRHPSLVPTIVIVFPSIRTSEWPRLIIILGVMNIEISQREPIVRNDEVNGIPGLAPIVLVEVRRPC